MRIGVIIIALLFHESNIINIFNILVNKNKCINKNIKVLANFLVIFSITLQKVDIS